MTMWPKSRLGLLGSFAFCSFASCVSNSASQLVSVGALEGPPALGTCFQKSSVYALVDDHEQPMNIAGTDVDLVFLGRDPEHHDRWKFWLNPLVFDSRVRIPVFAWGEAAPAGALMQVTCSQAFYYDTSPVRQEVPTYELTHTTQPIPVEIIVGECYRPQQAMTLDACSDVRISGFITKETKLKVLRWTDTLVEVDAQTEEGRRAGWFSRESFGGIELRANLEVILSGLGNGRYSLKSCPSYSVDADLMLLGRTLQPVGERLEILRYKVAWNDNGSQRLGWTDFFQINANGSDIFLVKGIACNGTGLDFRRLKREVVAGGDSWMPTAPALTLTPDYGADPPIGTCFRPNLQRFHLSRQVHQTYEFFQTVPEEKTYIEAGQKIEATFNARQFPWVKVRKWPDGDADLWAHYNDLRENIADFEFAYQHCIIDGSVTECDFPKRSDIEFLSGAEHSFPAYTQLPPQSFNAADFELVYLGNRHLAGWKQWALDKVGARFHEADYGYFGLRPLGHPRPLFPEWGTTGYAYAPFAWADVIDNFLTPATCQKAFDPSEFLDGGESEEVSR